MGYTIFVTSEKNGTTNHKPDTIFSLVKKSYLIFPLFKLAELYLIADGFCRIFKIVERRNQDTKHLSTVMIEN